jgi:hypothetical protein
VGPWPSGKADEITSHSSTAYCMVAAPVFEATIMFQLVVYQLFMLGLLAKYSFVF